MSLTGTFVYEVVAAEALVVRKGPSFGELTESFVAGGSLIACDRRVRTGHDIFVRLTDGRGWLFETKEGERCLEAVDVEHGLFVYHLLSPLGLRNQPTTGDSSRIGTEHRCAKGDRVTVDCLVRYKGNTFLRVRGLSTSSWLFEKKANAQGVLESMMEPVSLEYGKFIYEITNGDSGLVLRLHPNHASDKYGTAPGFAEYQVPSFSVVTSTIRVDGAHGDRCIYVERNGKTGWLFATRTSATTMRECTSRPSPITRQPGDRTQVMIGPYDDGWMVLFDHTDEAGNTTQKQKWYNMPSGLVAQINNCTAKGRHVTRFAATSDGAWYVAGERRDGSGAHRWWSGNVWLDEVIRGKSERLVSMAFGPYVGLRQVVVFGTNGFSTDNVDGLYDKLDDVHRRRGNIEKVLLLPDGQWFLAHDKGSTWVIANEHVTKELKSRDAVKDLTVGPDGSWVVVFGRRFAQSNGVPSDLSRQLASYFRDQNAVIDKRTSLIAQYDAALASLRTLTASFNGNGWSMSRIGPSHLKYESVVAQFLGCWQKGGTPDVLHVLQIRNPADVYARFEQYATRRGNVCRRFHGTSLHETCRGFHDLTSQPCEKEGCAVCNICCVGFSLAHAGSSTTFSRFGKGSYFSATSGKSHDYAAASERIVGGTGHVRLMFLCKVAIGRAYRTQEDMPNLTAPPAGYDAVVGVPGKTLNYDEAVVYDESAAVPSYLIAYSVK